MTEVTKETQEKFTHAVAHHLSAMWRVFGCKTMGVEALATSEEIEEYKRECRKTERLECAVYKAPRVPFGGVSPEAEKAKEMYNIQKAKEEAVRDKLLSKYKEDFYD